MSNSRAASRDAEGRLGGRPWWSPLLPVDRGPYGWGGWVFLGVVVPAFVLTLVVIFAAQIPTAYRLENGGGLDGTLTVTDVNCDTITTSRTDEEQAFCASVTGVFRSADGRVSEDGVLLNELEETTRLGDTYAVRYEPGSRPRVARLQGGDDWKYMSAMVGAGSSYLLGFVLFVLRRLRRPPHGHADVAGPG